MVGSSKVPFVGFLNAEPPTGFHRGSHLLCKIALPFSYPATPPATRAGAVRRSSDIERKYREKIGFRYGGPPGIAFGRPADQPAGMRIDRRVALAAFGSMAGAIAVMLVITVWGYMS